MLDTEGVNNNRQPFELEFRHRQQAQQSGLRWLAERTGGRAVLNSNELGDIFTQIEADFYGYYLLGYYPRNVREKDRFRKINVRVSRKNIKVRTGRGYFEPVPFPKISKAEKNLHLQRAVQADTSRGKSSGSSSPATPEPVRTPEPYLEIASGRRAREGAQKKLPEPSRLSWLPLYTLYSLKTMRQDCDGRSLCEGL